MKTIDLKQLYQNHEAGIKKFVKFFVLACVVVILILIINVGYQNLAAQTEINSVDNNFSKQYFEEIKPDGAKKISLIVNEVNGINGSEEKLNAIAKWETSDFQNPYWGNSFACYDPLCRYWQYENGKIRPWVKTIWSSPYKDDAYWIASQKVGACEELAVLFEEVASRSGFVTRVVTYPNQHAWVEVKNTNDEWWYFDSDCYHSYIGDPFNSTKWYNQTKYYRMNCLDFDNRILVLKTGEDISKSYESPKPQSELLHKDKLSLPMIKERFQRHDN